MDKIKAKIRLVFLPYLAVSLSTLIGYAFLHWLLFIKLNIFPVDEGIINIAMPMAISFIASYVWLDKKIKLLNLKFKVLNVSYYYIIVPIFGIGIQSIFTQQYIEEVGGKLTPLSTIDQIDKKEPTKYYSLKNFYLDKKHFSLYKYDKVSGKNNQDYKMLVYFAIPVLNSVKDTVWSNCTAWYGLRYEKTIDNSGNETENVNQFNQFVKQTMLEFGRLNVNQFVYLQSLAETEGRYDHYISAIQNNSKYDSRSGVVLLPFKGSFSARGDEDLQNALMTFTGGALLFLIMVLIPKLKALETETEEIKTYLVSTPVN